MAARLLEAVGRHVGAEGLERLGPDAQRAPVGGGVDQSGARQRAHARVQRGVDLARLDGLVAEQVALRRARLELAPGEDRLAGQALADGAWQAQVRGPGDDPLAARRQEQARAALGHDVVHHVQQLAGAADRVGLDARHPQLLGRALGLARPVLGRAQPAEELVDVPEVAVDVEQVADAALVEVRQVDPRAEDAASRVARVVDDAAAEHGDLDAGSSRARSTAVSVAGQGRA